MFPASWLFLMADGTMWIMNQATGTWTQAPVLPGSRVASSINYNQGAAYAAATDGTIWSGVVGAGFSWQQCGQTPP
jgi:hypothetical protein